ncbi:MULTISPECIES: DUF3142 domain-containing protein [Shewanella]|uniref:DUF3142 domain-containing protein n=1 Tax=Shewanella TaxID=22 RepID=UPI0009E0767A|nr:MULTISPECIES: DUF3142 domain-containing protein [Shewanella]MCH7423732.1 DUF3142 domain-containing protein [Shewanella sp. MM_2022_3]MCT8869785.1 DUF3142 domain-containing protein [Shewanella xiamenensis]NSM23472.1 DUF3142 domain-containing protein [Shewanella sp. ZOR0012]
MDLRSRYCSLFRSKRFHSKHFHSRRFQSKHFEPRRSKSLQAIHRTLSLLFRLSQLLALSFGLVSLSACQPANQETSSSKADTVAQRELSQEVYVWQRQWRDANQSALVESQSTFNGVRILALQAHPKPNGADIWFEVQVNHTWLQADPRPKVAVIRLDGQLTRLNNREALQKILALIQDWQAKGTRLAGIEIDHDSASSKLAAYNAFLRELKSQLPHSLKLSITSLPAWMSSSEFPALFDNIDELVLQIHSVSDPRLGLFDATQGWQWVEQLSRLAKVPYLIALPSYGSAVYSTAAGYRVESEVPMQMPLADTASSQHLARQELMADPLVLQSFVKKLHTFADTKLKGIIWFRLPLEGDKRVWPLSTLIAVAKQQPLAAHIELEILSQANTGSAQHEAPGSRLFQLVLVNKGNLAGKLPGQLSLAAQACSGYDAQNGYQAKLTQGILVWQLPQATSTERAAAPASSQFAPNLISAIELSPNGRRVIGWARCESLHLQGIYAP